MTKQEAWLISEEQFNGYMMSLIKWGEEQKLEAHQAAIVLQMTAEYIMEKLEMKIHSIDELVKDRKTKGH